MRRRTLIAAAAAALVLLCIAGVAYWRRSGRGAAYRRTMTVKRETLPVTITETGLVEPKEYEIVTSPITGILVELIEEGKYVRKGDIVARINDDEARENLETQEIAIRNRQALLRRAELDLELTTKDLEYERRKSQIALELAEMELEELMRKPAASVLALGSVDSAYWKAADKAVTKLAELDAEYAEIAEKTALKRYERQKTLAKKGVASDNDVAEERLKYERDRALHESAAIILELIRKGIPEGDIQIAREKVKQAKVKLAQIEQSTQAQIGLMKAAKAVAEAESNRTKESLEISKEILDSAVVKSPAEGTVLYWGQWGRPHEGDFVWRGNGFLSITRMGKMVVLTRVNEVDSRRIGVGQSAVIRLEAIPGKVYHGKVTGMAGLATDRDERQQGVLKKDLSGVMIFEVTVDIQEFAEEIFPTMSATVEIIVEELHDAITVPFSALIEQGEKKIVHVLDNGRVLERYIKVSQCVGSAVIVTEGLKEGDVICLR